MCETLQVFRRYFFMQIYLEDYIIKEKDFSAHDVATYIALRSIYDSRKEEFYISVRMIAYELYGNNNVPTRVLQHIRDSIYNWDGTIYEIVEELTNRNEFIIRPLGLYFNCYNPTTKEGSFFVLISLEEVQKIMNLDTTKDKMAILRFFTIVISSINKKRCVYIDGEELKNFVGNISISYLGNQSGIDDKTANSYLQILEDAEILYVYRHNKAVVDRHGGIKSLPHHYGRVEHCQYIKQVALDDEETFDCIDIKDANRKRKLSAMYNQIVRNPEKYKTLYQNEILEIYKYIYENKNKMNESIFDGIPCIEEYRKTILQETNNNTVLAEIEELLDSTFDTED